MAGSRRNLEKLLRSTYDLQRRQETLSIGGSLVRTLKTQKPKPHAKNCSISSTTVGSLDHLGLLEL